MGGVSSTVARVENDERHKKHLLRRVFAQIKPPTLLRSNISDHHHGCTRIWSLRLRRVVSTVFDHFENLVAQKIHDLTSKYLSMSYCSCCVENKAPTANYFEYSHNLVAIFDNNGDSSVGCSVPNFGEH